MDDELEFDLVDDSEDETTDDDNSEDTVPSDDTSKDDGESDTDSAKKGKKNSTREYIEKLKRENREMKQKLKEKEEDDTSDDVPTKPTSKFNQDKLDIFLIKRNAAEYEDWMKEILERYPEMELDDVLELAKAKNPTSTTEKDFSTKSVSKPSKKLKDLTEQEVLDYVKKTWDKKKLLEWERLKWRLPK